MKKLAWAFLLVALAFAVSFATPAAELDNYYVIPTGTFGGGYSACDGVVRDGAWGNYKGYPIYLTKGVIRLDTNIATGVTYTDVLLRVENPGKPAMNVATIQGDAKALNYVLDFAPDAVKVEHGGHVRIYVTCQTNGIASPIPSWLSGPTVQGLAYIFFRTAP